MSVGILGAEGVGVVLEVVKDKSIGSRGGCAVFLGAIFADIVMSCWYDMILEVDYW